MIVSLIRAVAHFTFLCVLSGVGGTWALAQEAPPRPAYGPYNVVALSAGELVYRNRFPRTMRY